MPSTKKYLIAGIAVAFAIVVLGLPFLEKASIRKIEQKQLNEGFKSYIFNKFTIGSPVITIIKVPSKETLFLNTVSPELYQKVQIGDTLVKLPGQNFCIISRKNYTEKVVYMKDTNN